MRPKKITLTVAALGLLFIFACVTVNIYFPAAKVEKTAEEVVTDVYGQPVNGDKTQENGDQSSLTRFLALFGPKLAHAQNAESVSNASIRGIKNELKANHSKLKPFYQAGNVGIDSNGMLVIRNQDGLGLQDVGQMRRLVNTDNQLRQSLYKEVARALEIDSSQAGQVQSIFAKKWREEAPSGYWIQQDNGSWKRK